MAEFALGLTKTAVEGAVSRVKSAFEEEAKLKVRVQNDLVFITGEFQMMRSFLNVANTERAKNEVVRTWVRQVRDLAFDVEDCVELVVHLDTNKSTWWWRLVPSCIWLAPPLPLDMAVAEIQQLKTRVEDVSQRNTRYNLISDSNSSSNSEVTTVSSSAAAEQPAAIDGASAFHILWEVWKAAGKMQGGTSDLERLIINEGNCIQVISLWGSQGAADLGVSRVITEAYNDPQIRQEFSIRARVKLLHPFNRDEFLKSLLTQFYVTEDHFRTTEEHHLIKTDELIQQVREHRYLVILEDVCTVEEWDIIRMYLPDTNKGSRIVVSTQQLGLALSCTGNPYQVLELRQFSHGHSLCAFINKDCGYNGNEREEASRPFSGREDEALNWVNTFELVGGQKYAAARLHNHLSRPKVGVSSVWGIAGVGKSVLVRSIYYKKLLRLDETFEFGNMVVSCDNRWRFRSFSWVNVPNPFNLTEFCWRLLLDFYSDDLESKETVAVCMIDGAQDPIQECRKFIRKECLVVIDGLRSKHDWDLIRDALLPEATKGCIIVIANEANVATHCVQLEDRVVNAKGLELDAALHLFTKVVWRGGQLNHEETEVSKLIIAKCGRLPKVIDAIGEWCLRSMFPIHKLEYLKNDFMGYLENGSEFPSLRGLFSWMKSYFDACSDALKPCIFYLSVFAADYNIRRRRLLRRWIAEGYSRDRFGISAEEDGEMLFSELVKLSIIQEPPREGNITNMFEREGIKVDVLQVNGFFHGYIMSRPMEDNLVFALEGRCSPNLKHAGQHLTIRGSWDRDEIVFKSMDLSRLRSFTVFGEWRSFFVSKDINMRLLRVLDLEDTLGVKDGDLEQIGKLLPRLKFLSLRGCKDITRLPDSLGGLRQLQTLDVRYTSIFELPPAIIKLQKLQYIRAGTAHEPLDQGHDPQPAAADHDGTRTSQTVVAAATPAASGDGTSTRQPTATSPVDGENDDRTSTALAQWRSRARDLVVSYSCGWSSKKKKKNDGGVEVPAAGIGNLTALHTLGVVKLSGAGGKAILKDVKKLTQLRKLGVSGINQKNWHDLCSVISGLGYLESLSVCLDRASSSLSCLGDMFSNLPESLKSFKLYVGDGKAQVSPVQMEQLRCNVNLTKVNLELTVSTQEDIESLKRVACQGAFRQLCVKPIQDGELHYGLEGSRFEWGEFRAVTVLKIDCGSYKSAIVLGKRIPEYAEVLVVHCSSTESSLELSGLENLDELKEVWLKGSYSDQLKQHLQQKVEEHENKPVLKLDPLETQQPAPPAPCACLQRLLR